LLLTISGPPPFLPGQGPPGAGMPPMPTGGAAPNFPLNTPPNFNGAPPGMNPNSTPPPNASAGGGPSIHPDRLRMMNSGR
jgi:U1 small nuclear ribonucleoprotein C